MLLTCAMSRNWLEAEMNLSTLDLFLVLTLFLAALGLFYALVYPYMSGERAAEKRLAMLVQPGKRATATRHSDNSQRRKQISESLKDLERRGRSDRSISMEQRLMQAGLRISKVKFYLASLAFGLLAMLIAFIFVEDRLVHGAIFFVGAVGIPRWLLIYLRNRRLKLFVQKFPDAIDVIIRGVRAGLPLIDSLRVVAAEMQEPIRSEFLLVIESQAVGMTLTEAVDRLSDRVPISEARFFSILIGIQQKSGGNLAEGLGNLSRVLRDRKRLAQKIRSMSSEAKASAGIIGSLPFLVGGLVQFTSPGYMDMLWLTLEGRVMLALCAIWMGIGILVMRRMISFDV
jgi:tight adherence protein B